MKTHYQVVINYMGKETSPFVSGTWDNVDQANILINAAKQGNSWQHIILLEGKYNVIGLIDFKPIETYSNEA